jgi:predicted nucleic acid-binding protein
MKKRENVEAVSPVIKRTYIDANLLIAAWHGKGDAGFKALEVLDDPDRRLVVSDALWLEVMPKPLYFGNHGEIEFYRGIFGRAEHLPWQLQVLEQARALAERHGIAAMDAIHIATAISAGVDEFVSGEKPDKPMFRVTEIPVRSLR